METRASYILVGTFVLSLIAGLFAFVLWLAKVELKDERVYYYIYFPGSVSGLQVGAPVQFRGVPVGTVTSIDIDAENVELIEVTVALRAGTPVKTDSVASLQAQGITGLSFILLSGGTQGAEPLTPRPGKRRAVIPSTPSTLEKFFESAPELIARIGEVAVRVAALLSDENIRHIDSIIDNLDRSSAALAVSMLEVPRTIDGAQAAIADARGLIRDLRGSTAKLDALMADLRGLAQRVGSNVDRLGASGDRTLNEIGVTVQSLQRTAAEIEKLVADTRTPLRDFSQTGLYELNQFLAEARVLIAALTRIAANLERDPARYLFGDQQKGFEAK